MPEAIGWPEGYVYLYSGSLAASALVALAENTQITFAYGWDNRPAAGGIYYDHLTGQRADVTIGATYMLDITTIKMMQSATALHMKFLHSGINGSAGHWLYSGRIDNYAINGRKGDVYKLSIKGHFNVWTAF